MGSAPSSNRNGEGNMREEEGARRRKEEQVLGNDGVEEDCPVHDARSEKIEYHDPRRPAGGGMPLVHYMCRKKKKSYDKCVHQWYSTDFLSGTGASPLNQAEVCGEKFEKYRACILKGIKKEIWDKQNLPPPLEGSPLDEIMDDDDDK